MTTQPVTPGAFAPRRGRPGAALVGLARARRTVSLYGSEHPVTERTIGEVFDALQHALEGRRALRIGILEDTFVMGRSVLLEESLRLSSLLLDLRDRQIGLIEFLPGLEPWEVTKLAEVLSLRPGELQRFATPMAALVAKGVTHVALAAGRPLGADDEVEVRVDPRDVYRAGLRVIDDLFHQASRDAPLDLRKAGMVVTSLLDVLSDDRAALLGIAALRHYDEETAHHSVNVAILALMVSQRLRLDRPMLMAVGLAALLHDIGKIRVPREILNKESPLTADEMATLRRHTFYGAHLLRNLPGVARLAMVVAFEHHANYNLSGYPTLVAKDAPHPLARLIHIADFYDASVASTSGARGRMLPHLAMRFIIDGAGRTFDPMLARVFQQVLGTYPIGSVVELSSGEIAVVQRPSDGDAERPIVKVVSTAKGPVDPRVIDLEDTVDVHIARGLDPEEAGIDARAHL
jgi:putative nucleotidyltransferase with HDIG domain